MEHQQRQILYVSRGHEILDIGVYILAMLTDQRVLPIPRKRSIRH